jgi:hypothetical protein
MMAGYGTPARSRRGGMAHPDTTAPMPSSFTIRAYENVEPWAAYDALREKGPLISGTR